MKMIHSEIITFGEIMMRLSVASGQRWSQATELGIHFGGGEANVAVGLSSMGESTKFVSALPNNPIGQSCIGKLRQYGVDTTSIVTTDNRMGVYYLEQGVGQRPSEVVYDRANSAFAELEPGTIDWKGVLKGATWFHWSGISPGVSEKAALVTKEAVVAASEVPGLTISVDLNYRAKLWKYDVDPIDVMPELVQHCDVLVGNEGHNNYMLGIDPVNGLGKTAEADLKEACLRVSSKFPRIKTVALALRENHSASHNSLGAYVLSNGKAARSTTFDIQPIVDRIGGGDAFMAGLIYGLRQWPSDQQRIINFAVGTSVLKHAQEGDFSLSSLKEIEQLIQSNGTGHVSR